MTVGAVSGRWQKVRRQRENGNSASADLRVCTMIPGSDPCLWTAAKDGLQLRRQLVNPTMYCPGGRYPSVERRIQCSCSAPEPNEGTAAMF